MVEPVAITGLGIVCALGTDKAIVAEGLRAGRRCFGPVQRFDASSFRVNLAAEVPQLDIQGRFGRRRVRQLSRTDQLALWAAADALAQAEVQPEAVRNAAVFVGASSGGMYEMEVAQRARLQDGVPISPLTYAAYPVWATAVALKSVLGLRGPRATYMTACSSGAHALGIAMQRVRTGETEIALAGGAESLCCLTLAGFGSLGVLDPQGTRPLSCDRKGLTLGEGAAFFVLESAGRARRRNAPVLGWLLGYGGSSDAHHMVHPLEDGSGALAAMQAALADASLAAREIDYVNMHGTGTIQNDAMEARALRRLVEERPGVRVSSSKSMVGHTLGAAGAIEAAFVLLSMGGRFLPPNPGAERTAMPELGPLELVSEAGTTPPGIAVSTSFAFGGNNAALVLAAPEMAREGSKVEGPVAGKAASRHTVVVTGGAVACRLGTANTAESLAGFVRHPTVVDAVELVGLDPGQILGRSAVRRMDELSKTALATMVLAVKGAGVGDLEGAGISFGTSFGALDASAAFLNRLFLKGPTLVNPLDFPNLVHNAPGGQASIYLGAKGPNVTPCQEELCSDEGLRVMADRISRGTLRLALAGGGDCCSALLDEGYARLDRLLGTRSRHASVLGAVVLESAEAAQARGAQAWARILGVGAAGPWGGVQAAVGRALEEAATRTRLPLSVEVWYGGSTGSLDESKETQAQHLPALRNARREQLRVLLGDAGGAGTAAVAVAAATIGCGEARSVLVTSVSRDGSAVATLLGAPA